MDSEPDDVALARAVEDKFLTICELHLRVKGTKLQIPDDLFQAVLLWRRARARHKKSDFRHSQDEMRAMREVAEWTLAVNAELRGQEEVPEVNWR